MILAYYDVPDLFGREPVGDDVPGGVKCHPSDVPCRIRYVDADEAPNCI